MKLLPVLLVTALTLPLYAAPRAKGRPFRGKGGDFEERAAMREEAMLEHLDTHKWKQDPAATDKRPDNLGEYTNRTHQRIVRLLHHGALTEANGKRFKEQHTEIVTAGREMREQGELTSDQKTALRKQLDDLNDEINGALEKAEEGSQRSPILNHVQHRFEEQIEFGVSSGRLSKGEASRLNRMVARLAALEDREKEGGLSTKEREKLFEEAKEISRELRDALTD